MNEAARKFETQDIVVEDVLPHTPETIWKTLTAGELIGRWLKMTPVGFEPVKGRRFTFQTTPAGVWDGVIQCQVLDVIPNERLVYSWKGWTPSSPSPFPGLKPARGFAWSIPASCSRRTIRLSRIWAEAGRKLSRASALSPRNRFLRKSRTNARARSRRLRSPP